MKLDHITITHYRCFEQLPILLEKDVTVFVGTNGAGKSTILDAIAVALYDIAVANGGARGETARKKNGVALKDGDIQIVPNRHGISDGPQLLDWVESNIGTNGGDRKGFVQISASASDYYPVPGFPASNNGIYQLLEWDNTITFSPPASFKYDTQNTSRLKPIYEYFRSVWREIQQNPQSIIPLPAVAYYRPLRRLSGISSMGDIFAKGNDRSTAFEQALDAGVEASYATTFRWLYVTETYAIRGNDRYKKLLDVVRNAVIQMFENITDIGFSGEPPRLRATYNDADSAHTLDIDQLSDGYRILLGLVMDFARRLAVANPNSPNPLEEPGIMLIDEIELHLHPAWQQTVIQRLKEIFPETQLIVSTHSPQVLSTVHRNQVRVLTNEHEILPLPHDVGTYGVESSQALEQVFGVQSRPSQGITSVANLSEYLRLIEQGEGTSEKAKDLRRSLEADMGRSEQALTRADMRIRQLQILGARK